MAWYGSPEWTGGVEEDLDLEGKLIPLVDGELFFVQIEGCEDYFLMIFPTMEKLDKIVPEFMKQLDIKLSYTAESLTKEMVLGLDNLRKASGVRLMYDPEIINRHHTKWKEVIYNGEQWKFAAPRN